MGGAVELDVRDVQFEAVARGRGSSAADGGSTKGESENSEEPRLEMHGGRRGGKETVDHGARGS